MPNTQFIIRDRPSRWDHPLDPNMMDLDIQWLLDSAPFSQMNPAVFEANGSMEAILRHDARILTFDAGDVITREGDYGSSAYIVIDGTVRAFLVALWEKHIRESQSPRSPLPLFKNLLDFFGPSNSRDKLEALEKRENSRGNHNSAKSTGRSNQRAPVQQIVQSEGRNRIFIQDIDAVLHDYQSESLGPGHLFGELAAITRTPHRFSVVADSKCIVLEIRWQGLRLLRRDPWFKSYLDERYSQSGLQSHLRETPLFRFLNEETLPYIVEATKLESYGDMEWFSDYRDAAEQDSKIRIEKEPLIAREGTAVDDLFLIRAGFARVSFEHGFGHQTEAYLGRGQMFGLDELAHSFRTPESNPLPYQFSLRALGFVDVLRIPRRTIMKLVLPQVRKSELPPLILQPRYSHHGRIVPDVFSQRPSADTQTPLVEFLVEERIINGQQTMLIDLDRCTGCDECVKACAQTHEGTPRFVRNGPQYGELMFAHACMHCVDPVCMIGCPTGAIARNPDSGVISIQTEICIGCKTCSESCPYENIVMLEVRDKSGRIAIDRQTQLPILQASKCDLCQNLKTGPACQNACPHKALYRINTSDSQSLQKWIQKKAS